MCVCFMRLNCSLERLNYITGRITYSRLKHKQQIIYGFSLLDAPFNLAYYTRRLQRYSTVNYSLSSRSAPPGLVTYMYFVMVINNEAIELGNNSFG